MYLRHLILMKNHHRRRRRRRRHHHLLLRPMNLLHHHHHHHHHQRIHLRNLPHHPHLRPTNLLRHLILPLRRTLQIHHPSSCSFRALLPFNLFDADFSFSEDASFPPLSSFIFLTGGGAPLAYAGSSLEEGAAFGALASLSAFLFLNVREPACTWCTICSTSPFRFRPQLLLFHECGTLPTYLSPLHLEPTRSGSSFPGKSHARFFPPWS